MRPSRHRSAPGRRRRSAYRRPDVWSGPGRSARPPRAKTRQMRPPDSPSKRSAASCREWAQRRTPDVEARLGQVERRHGFLRGELSNGVRQCHVAVEILALQPWIARRAIISGHVVLRTLCRAGQETASQRAIGHESDPQGAQRWQRRALDVAFPQRVEFMRDGSWFFVAVNGPLIVSHRDAALRAALRESA
jgi:hypothetical protein